MTDPMTILMALLAGEPVDRSTGLADQSGRDVYLDESIDFFDPQRLLEQESVELEMVTKYRVAVATVSAAWGPPLYDVCPVPAQPWETTQKPAAEQTLLEQRYWRGAVALACWKRDDQLAYVLVEHEDKELPYFLMLGVCSGVQP